MQADDDKPREKLMHKGKSTLSDAELIAILIGSGNSNESAVELSRRILRESNDNLINLSRMSLSDLIKFKGIGEAKAISIIAALELGKRRRSAEAHERKVITSSKDAFEAIYAQASHHSYEKFWVILLDQAKKSSASLKSAKAVLPAPWPTSGRYSKQPSNQMPPP